MAENEKMQAEELEQVAGGIHIYNWTEVRRQAEERGTCNKCGKKFEDAEHEKTSLPPIMNADMQKLDEINWCGDCIFEYWQEHGKGWESFRHKFK